ncbi:MAG: dTDP-4-dehydrorhamnose 3,5-epimerase [Thermodesulfobacteriota bacterium]
MRIVDVRSLAVPEVKIIEFFRYRDHRGYFTETFRRQVMDEMLEFLRGTEFVQGNESHSHRGVIRGLHFQWNPYMGKLVRVIQGRMIDFALDVRTGSATFGKIVAYDLNQTPDAQTGQWIWVPPGFAHGCLFCEDSTIEYLCTGKYNPACEAAISPFSEDIDWSLCDPVLRAVFEELSTCTRRDGLVSDKDRDGLTLTQWASDPRSENFVYGQMG